MFIDSHCHIDCIELADYDNSLSKLIHEITNNNVEHMLCVCIDLNKFDEMYGKVKAFDNISVSAGMHPIHSVGDALSVDQILQYVASDKVVAVGETGLDYFYEKDQPEWQKERFRHHITAAKEVKKPVIVHTRDAQKDTINILKEESVADCGGVIHCFTEDWDFAKKALDQNLYLSFSGISTFKTAEQIREVIRKVPEDRFLIETDSPYLAPVPMRGKQNQPGFVKYVAECIARERKMSIEEVAAVSKQNYYNFLENK